MSEPVFNGWAALVIAGISMIAVSGVFFAVELARRSASRVMLRSLLENGFETRIGLTGPDEHPEIQFRHPVWMTEGHWMNLETAYHRILLRRNRLRSD